MEWLWIINVLLLGYLILIWPLIELIYGSYWLTYLHHEHVRQLYFTPSKGSLTILYDAKRWYLHLQTNAHSFFFSMTTTGASVCGCFQRSPEVLSFWSQWLRAKSSCFKAASRPVTRWTLDTLILFEVAMVTHSSTPSVLGQVESTSLCSSPTCCFLAGRL